MRYTGSMEDVSLPRVINNLIVTHIGDRAFSSNSLLRNITIPNTVTNLGNEVFCACPNLIGVHFQGNAPTIGTGVFDGTTKVTAYYLLETTGWGTTLGGRPAKLWLLPSQAFNCTTNAGTITIGGYNGSDEEITIPGTFGGLLVRHIDDGAFGHSGFTKVTISSTVTNIGDGAFAYSSNLTSLWFLGDAPGLGSGVFEGDASAIVYYLPGTKGWGSTFGGLPTMLWKPQLQSGGASFGVQTNRYGFNITWTSGRTIIVEACTNLANPVWFPLQTITLTGDSFYFADPQRTNYPGLFYRIRSP